ncbi:MAG: VWA domain-containing protein [Luteitalea sp.]|nr:VWA domain-containing protein [Luteitalea sp.]
MARDPGRGGGIPERARPAGLSGGSLQMNQVTRIAAFGFALFGAATLGVGAAQQDVPRFRSSVELTTVDVTVLDDRGQPISGLTAADFEVRVDGDARSVISAEWVPLDTPLDAVAPPPPPLGYSSNENATGGRLILIVVDEANIRAGGTLGIRRSMNDFIDGLQPSDRAAIVGIGPAAPSTPFTADRQVLKKAIERLVGQQRSFMSQYNVSISEALDIRTGLSGTLGNVIARECSGLQGFELGSCAMAVEMESSVIAQSGVADGERTVSALRSLFVALRRIDAPKTVLFVSEGFMLGDQEAAVAELGALAAAARTTVYSLKLDDSMFTLSVEQRRAATTPFQDRAARAEGLERLAAAARGSLYNVIGSGAGVFARLTSELSGYYLLGLESSPSDKDGKPHPIRVEVSHRGATVRSRRALLTLPADARPGNQREAMLAALTAPLPVSALPIRIATFTLKGPETDRLQMLIHADVGTDYSTSRVVALGYTITDSSGRMVDSQGTDTRLPPIMNGVPSALQFSGGASLPPGDYSLKFAVAEGDRVGTIEHPIHATLVDAGSIQVSDLMVGGPTSSADGLLQPTVGYRVVFGSVHGYLEAYGSDAASISATYEIAPEEDGAPLMSEPVAARSAGETRAIFTRVMPVGRLPPGRYVLRVTLTSGDAPLKTLTRAFEVAAPTVLMTSATAPTAVAPSEIYLPVTDAMLARPFDRREASDREVLKAFRSRVPAERREAFDKGVALLAAGDYGQAEASFKTAIDPSGDSTAVIAYLAASYAASGHDTEAAGAWQTALIDGSDLPQIYRWLGDTLLRTRDVGQARAILEEAVGKWPTDLAFTKPMALLYATFGQGREAVRTLERYLAGSPSDTEAHFMAVEWLYQLRAAGAAAHSPAEDLKRARGYADVYFKAKGPQAALLKQWLEAMAGERR